MLLLLIKNKTMLLFPKHKCTLFRIIFLIQDLIEGFTLFKNYFPYPR